VTVQGAGACDFWPNNGVPATQVDLTHVPSQWLGTNNSNVEYIKLLSPETGYVPRSQNLVDGFASDLYLRVKVPAKISFKPSNVPSYIEMGGVGEDLVFSGLAGASIISGKLADKTISMPSFSITGNAVRNTFDIMPSVSAKEYSYRPEVDIKEGTKLQDRLVKDVFQVKQVGQTKPLQQNKILNQFKIMKNIGLEKLQLQQLQLMQTKQISQVKQLEKTKQTQKTTGKQTQKTKSPFNRIKPEPIIKPVFTSQLSQTQKLAKQILESEGDGFEVFTRTKGEDISIGKTKTKRQAVELLAGRLRGTLRASGFVAQGERRLGFEEIGLTGEFEKSTEDPFRVIPRKTRRLGTRSETSEIFRAKKIKGGFF
jgi:hypothetical protein